MRAQQVRKHSVAFRRLVPLTGWLHAATTALRVARSDIATAPVVIDESRVSPADYGGRVAAALHEKKLKSSSTRAPFEGQTGATNLTAHAA